MTTAHAGFGQSRGATSNAFYAAAAQGLLTNLMERLHSAALIYVFVCGSTTVFAGGKVRSSMLEQGSENGHELSRGAWRRTCLHNQLCDV